MSGWVRMNRNTEVMPNLATYSIGFSGYAFWLKLPCTADAATVRSAFSRTASVEFGSRAQHMSMTEVRPELCWITEQSPFRTLRKWMTAMRLALPDRRAWREEAR